MKTSAILDRILKSTAAVILTAGLLSAGTAWAGGNIGQQKGASQLMKSPATVTPAKSAAQPAAMNCPKCQNMTVTRAANEKGQFKSTIVTQKHLCPTCEQKIVTTGTGKQAKVSVKHQCAENANAGCMAAN